MDDNFQMFDGANSHYKPTSSPLVLRWVCSLRYQDEDSSFNIHLHFYWISTDILQMGPSVKEPSAIWATLQSESSLEPFLTCIQVWFTLKSLSNFLYWRGEGRFLRSVLTRGKSGKSWNKTCGLPLLLLLGLRTSPCYVLSFCSSQMINL